MASRLDMVCCMTRKGERNIKGSWWMKSKRATESSSTAISIKSSTLATTGWIRTLVAAFSSIEMGPSTMRACGGMTNRSLNQITP